MLKLLSVMTTTNLSISITDCAHGNNSTPDGERFQLVFGLTRTRMREGKTEGKIETGMFVCDEESLRFLHAQLKAFIEPAAA